MIVLFFVFMWDFVRVEVDLREHGLCFVVDALDVFILVWVYDALYWVVVDDVVCCWVVKFGFDYVYDDTN